MAAHSRVMLILLLPSKECVDPQDNKMHTQNVENMWMRVKRKLKRRFRTISHVYAKVHVQECDPCWQRFRYILTEGAESDGYALIIEQWSTLARTWWIYDANQQCPFKSAYRILPYLQGLNKPVYHEEGDVGDHVVVFNTKHIAMRGAYWRTFKHFHHTRYAGGFSRASAWRVHELDPTRIVEKAVYSRLSGLDTRKKLMARLHLFPEDDVPQDILENVTGQIRQVQIVPKKLSDYTQEEIDNFPRMFQLPENYDIESYKRENRQEPDQHTSKKWRLK